MKNLTVSSNLQRALWAQKTRRDPTDPYAWAMTHRQLRGRRLVHIPAMADILRDNHPFVVVQKSAQIGVSEAFVSLGLWGADTGHAGRGNVLFLMPTQNQMDDFSQARFDTAIADSSYLRSRSRPEPPGRKGANRLRLKSVGPGYIYFRGAESKRQIASVDADVVILDEFDQMPDGVLGLARKRLASSSEGRLRIGSTPRYPEAGVNALYRASDRRRYHIPCRSCGLEQPLTFEDNVDVERVAVVCRECREPIDNAGPGRWVAEAPLETAIRGYHLTRLYSPWLNLPELIDASTASSVLELQEFYNSDLGEVFSPPGGGLTPVDLDRCIQDYSLEDYAGEKCLMGIDVGTRLHIVIRDGSREWVNTEHYSRQRAMKVPPRLRFAGTVSSFDELDQLYERFNVELAVIDAQPETRKAVEFVNSHRGSRTAYYRPSGDGYELRHASDGLPDSIHMNRVMAIDECFERFRNGEAYLPTGARQLGGRVKDGYGDYYRQLLAPQRTLEQDAQQNWVQRWIDNSRPDHFAHAEVYCWAAAHVLSRTGLGIGFLPMPNWT